MILSESNDFSQILRFPLGQRPGKPRVKGLTMVIDKGLGYNEMEDLVESAGNYIDYIKFGFGTACLYSSDVLKRKIGLCRLYDIHPCTGGTLAEVALAQDQFEAMVDTALTVGFTAIEISDGTLTLDRTTRKRAIQTVSAQAVAITEVGKKLESFPAIEVIVDQILRDLDAGSSCVIVEGRESGENVGIYGRGGEVAQDILNHLVRCLPSKCLDQIMWEAPKKSQQVALLQRFGQQVNLGNIAPCESIALECLRLGLRGDTFAWSLANGNLLAGVPDQGS